MLSALLIALREGVEAALVVGIVLVYLNRTGRRALTRYVWAGVALASLCSILAALLLQRWQVSEDGFEGVLMLVAAALVVSMIIWMNRIARNLKKEIEQRVEVLAQKPTRAAGWAIGARAETECQKSGWRSALTSAPWPPMEWPKMPRRSVRAGKDASISAGSSLLT